MTFISILNTKIFCTTFQMACVNKINSLDVNEQSDILSVKIYVKCNQGDCTF